MLHTEEEERMHRVIMKIVGGMDALLFEVLAVSFLSKSRADYYSFLALLASAGCMWWKVGFGLEL
jgi:hypothetical protein